jgi:hypothetical protein
LRYPDFNAPEMSARLTSVDLMGSMTTPWRARSKQERTRRTLQQLEELEAVFASNRYPTTGIKASLADKFGITLRQIQVWFQNR